MQLTAPAGEGSSDDDGDDSSGSEEESESEEDDSPLPARGLHNLLQPELLGPSSGSDWGELQLADDQGAAAAGANGELVLVQGVGVWEFQSEVGQWVSLFLGGLAGDQGGAAAAGDNGELLFVDE